MTGKHTNRNNAGDRLVEGTLVPVRQGRVVLPEALAGELDELTVRFAASTWGEGLMAASVAIGLDVLDQMMQGEVTDLAGPRGRRDLDRTHVRHGTEAGSVVLGGRKVPVRRPRVRTADDISEATLEVYEIAHAEDLLAKDMVGSMLAGLSTRRYPAALEPVGAEVEAHAQGTSKSTVSRRFVNATTEQLGSLMARRLDTERWLIMFIDGFTFADHLLVGALGVTADGTKVPLAVMEGTTENKTLVTRLLADLQDRGLDVSGGVLFVVDGSKALTKGIPAVFGPEAVIQRCRLHKERKRSGSPTRS